MSRFKEKITIEMTVGQASAMVVALNVALESEFKFDNPEDCADFMQDILSIKDKLIKHVDEVAPVKDEGK